MEIYLDVILLENFIVDIFLLKITSKALRKKITLKREFLGGGLATLYTLVMIFKSLKIFTLIPFQIIVLYEVINISFKDSNFIFKLKAMGTYLVGAFLLSGLCMMFSVNGSFKKISNVYEIKDYSIKGLLISVMIVYMVFSRIFEYIKERALINNFTYDIEFFIGNSKYEIKGFLDTGNELREPITNFPCIIVEENFIKNVSEKEVYYIPYKSIGYVGGLKGFLGKQVRIRQEKGGGWKEINAIICPCKEVLSKERDFNALLSRGVI